MKYLFVVRRKHRLRCFGGKRSVPRATAIAATSITTVPSSVSFNPARQLMAVTGTSSSESVE